MKKSFFCVLPWLSVNIDQLGDCRPCCSANAPLHNCLDSDGQIDIGSALHSLGFQELRQQFLNGEIPQTCQTCVANEKAGQESERVFSNKQFEKEQKAILSEQNIESDTPFTLKKLNIRATNLCNLACRMCTPFDSQKLQNEYLAYDPNPNIQESLEKIRERKVFHKEEHWSEIFKHSENLQILYVAGGEPTLIEGFWSLVSKLQEQKWAGENLELMISTNGTQLKEHHIELLNSFKETSLFFSVDATGDLYNFIRRPAKWESTRETLRLFFKHKKEDEFIPKVFITVSTYNILSLSEIVQELLSQVPDLDDEVEFRFVDEGPDDIRNLPSPLKAKACKRLLALASNPEKKIPGEILKGLFMVIKFLNQKGEHKEFENFLKKMSTFDKMRKEKTTELIPEYAPWLSEQREV